MSKPPPEYVPSQEHEACAAAILKWYGHVHRMHRKGEWDKELFLYVLFGLAGTGKTTLVTRLLPELGAIGWDIQIVAFTNKARNILNRKITEAERDLGIQLPYRARTIHNLIYKVIGVQEDENLNEQLIEVPKDNSDLEGADLLILDEASMVKHKYGSDLESHCVPTLVIGDPKQLHPVKGRAYYTRGRQPNFLLIERHRTHDKEIMALGDRLRQGLPMPNVGYDKGSVKVIYEHQLTNVELLEADILLVGEHQTRHTYNRKMRQLKGYTGEIPYEGEPVICWETTKTPVLDLTDPNKPHWTDVANGSAWTVSKAELEPFPIRNGESRFDHSVVKMLLVNKEEPEVGQRPQVIDVRVFPEWLHGRECEIRDFAKASPQRFVFGYAITTHKAQADGYDKVIWFDEPVGTRRDWDWRYTAATRAAENLIVVWKPQKRRGWRRS
jgi:exodeoxyribonuclease-5